MFLDVSGHKAAALDPFQLPGQVISDAGREAGTGEGVLLGACVTARNSTQHSVCVLAGWRKESRDADS